MLWLWRWSAPPISLPDWIIAMNDSNTNESNMIESEMQPNRPEFAAEEGLKPDALDELTNSIIAALKTVFDPEIPADIYELGLIYRVDIDDSRFVKIDMTLTAPGCPVAGEMPIWVENAVAAVPGIAGVEVKMVFDPPWDQSRMSDEARVALDMW
jgi:FeS assembly SUF system protein